ncbi:hypothetical protein B5E77_15385, partial [Lachnoclostridium sp. An131]
ITLTFQYSIFKAATERWFLCHAIKGMDTLYFSFSIFKFPLIDFCVTQRFIIHSRMEQCKMQ